MDVRTEALDLLFRPRSVAVVGASDDPTKWGHELARQLVTSSSARTVHMVNRRGGTVLGRPTLSRLTEVDEPVDVVAVCVPAGGFLDAVRDALQVGARAVVGITAGLGEADAEGRAIERDAVALVRAAGAVLVGPNCLGIADTSTDLVLSSDPFTAGGVTVLSQSGNLVLDLDLQLAAAGLGIARFVSLGNQADLTLAELVRHCARHDATRAIAVYAEDLRDGRAFVAAAREAASAGRPVVLLAPGRSEAAVRGAASHTGALTSPTRVVDAVCAAAAVHRVDTPGEMVDLLLALNQPRRATGRRVAVLTDGGGHGAIAADAVTAQRLEVPLLSDELGVRLRTALWQPSPVANPVDLAGIGEQDPASYSRAVAELLASDEVDAVLMTGYFGGYALHGATDIGRQELDAAQALAVTVASQDKPVVVHSIYPHSESVRVLAAAGLPVYRDPAAAARALRALVAVPVPDDDLAMPTPAAPLADTGYATVRAALAEIGVPFPPMRLVRNAVELDAAIGDLGFPLVLKAMGLLHKSDAGGVVLGLDDAAAARAAYDDLVLRLAPPAVSVESMVDAGAAVEVIVGVRRDARCGPVVMVGLGGVLTEVLDDVAVGLAPVTRAQALALLRSLRGAAVLEGARGREPVDLESLAQVVMRIAALAARHPELSDLEVNPLLASVHGAVALDARALASIEAPDRG